MIRRLFQLAPVGTVLLLIADAQGDPSIFCYRIGVDILSAGGSRMLAAARPLAPAAKETLPEPKRNQVACFHLFSTFFARFSTQKD